MTKLELLNTFLNDRLTAAAEEIFRAVKDTVLEYQSEILRSKEENERLQRLLDVAVQRLLLQQPDVPSAQCGGEGQAGESRGGAEPPAPVKEEPRCQSIQTGAPGDGEVDTARLVPASRPHPMPGASPPLPPPLPTSREVKTEGAGRRAAPPSSSTTAWSNVAKKRAEQQGRKPNVHLLQIKNVKSLKPVSLPGPGIPRWHSCRECGKGFSFACQLEVHMRWHTKEKPYSCSVCRKSFTTVSMLKRHHRIHTGEKPFRCHVCGKCFNQSAHLNTHFRLHTRERASWSRGAAAKT